MFTLLSSRLLDFFFQIIVIKVYNSLGNEHGYLPCVQARARVCCVCVYEGGEREREREREGHAGYNEPT